MTTNNCDGVVEREMALLAISELFGAIERVRCVRRMMQATYAKMGLEFEGTPIDKLDVADRCLTEVLVSGQRFVEAQIIGLRPGADAAHGVRMFESLDDTPPQSLTG